MKQWLLDNWEIIAGLIGSALTYLLGTKKRKTEGKTTELENLQTIRDLEKQIVDDVKSQIDELREINNGLQVLIEQKDEIIEKQQNVIDQQRELILQQTNEIKVLKGEAAN